MGALSQQSIAPLIVGFDGTTLDEATKQAFLKLRPAGFILFKRNCESRPQLEKLCADLHALSPVNPPMIFIDQEGGRVNRILWDPYIGPTARTIGDLYAQDQQAGLRAAELNGYVIAAQLATYGITVDCLPVADVPIEGAHDIIGDRAFSFDPQTVAALCGATMKGLIAGGVWPVLKHLPGHGRAFADSHLELPEVDTSRADLDKTDFLPVRVNAAAPFVMTAHVAYTALDGSTCATFSSKILNGLLRKELGVTGLIVSDDLYMQALDGDLQSRADRSLAAGCDLLICGSSRIDGRFDAHRWEEMLNLKLPPLTAEAAARIAKLPALGRATAENLHAAYHEVQQLLGRAAA